MKSILIAALATSSALASNVTLNIKAPKQLIVTAKAQYFATKDSLSCKELRSNGGIFPGMHAKIKDVSISTKNGKIVVAKELDSKCKYKLDSLNVEVSTKSHNAYNSSYVAAYMTNGKGYAVKDCSINGVSSTGTKFYGVGCFGDSIQLDKNSEAIVEFRLK